MEYIPAKTIVTRTKSTSWFGTSYNMNLYKGCCHGCIYCDSRSDCYGVEEFDRVRAKQDALRIVRDDLRRKVKPGVIATGAMSDPYNPFERELLLTRHALELVSAFGFGIAIATKSDLLLRDVDVLQEIKALSPVLCKVTVTAWDDGLGKRLEPGAPPSSRRFEVIRELSKAGLFAGILMMPIVPFLEDTEENVLGIVERAADCGARFIYPAFGMTCRPGQREYFLERLEREFPGLGEKFGRRYGERYSCASPRAGKLWHSFAAACDRRGILYQMQDIIRAYKLGYQGEQLSFLT